jgi:hypothetical protein
MNQRLRRERQYDHGRHRQGAECHGATVDNDRNQHDGGHEKRTLGRDVAAGQQQIKGGGGQRRGRRPFLDRKCQAALEIPCKRLIELLFIGFCPGTKTGDFVRSATGKHRHFSSLSYILLVPSRLG